ncbi:MAG TPA: L-histidine N(alpha)-methyltransferase [Gemmatimonadaceae bacterium]|nr:L-histidine N(alpha)-methyltransferase [Gemmatimonadaceae bacterium]
MADPMHQTRDSEMLHEVREGLSRRQKELSPKFFYDHRGSELFEEITALPEYYLTRAERALLHSRAAEIARVTEARALVELGAGSADKTRILLDAMVALGAAGMYAPVDVSESFLADSAARLEREYPSLTITPVVADLTAGFTPPAGMPRPALFAFLGSTIGNFDAIAAVRLLARIRAAMRQGDALLLGADLRKDVARIEAAYNDARGVTAEFNRNMLVVLNRELGADFAPGAFAHYAFFAEEAGRIEMHLVSTREQRVHIPGMPPVRFADGESIRTEISCKYDRARLESMFERAGLLLTHWYEREEDGYALALAVPAT